MRKVEPLRMHQFGKDWTEALGMRRRTGHPIDGTREVVAALGAAVSEGFVHAGPSQTAHTQTPSSAQVERLLLAAREALDHLVKVDDEVGPSNALGAHLPIVHDALRRMICDLTKSRVHPAELLDLCADEIAVQLSSLFTNKQDLAIAHVGLIRATYFRRRLRLQELLIVAAEVRKQLAKVARA